MIFTLNNLKNFIYSIDKRKINKIQIKTQNMEILINKNINTISKNITIHNQNQINTINQKTLNSYENYLESSNEPIKKSSNNSILIKDETETYSTIISPMVGTFYRSPAPNEPVFIEKNDIVQKKQTVCIIEAMKLMNEIESEVKGEIIDILVNDGDIVDCGQALMKVKTI